MKEVVKVSISGIAFTFDADAYCAMKEYLDKLNAGYTKNPDGREIVADIEARIAELILSEQDGDRIVELPLVESIINQLGYPDDIDGSVDIPVESFPRRLYRKKEGRVIAGVCSGLGAYFKVDPVWIRVGIFAPLILTIFFAPFGAARDANSFLGPLFAVFVLLYFILWVAIPMAKTPRQKLEMRGEKITASSIKQSVRDETAEPKQQRTASVFADVMYVFGKIILFFLKFIVGVVAFGMVMAAIGIMVAVIAVLVGGVGVLSLPSLHLMEGMVGITPVVYVVLILLAILIPIMMIGYFLMKLLFSSKVGKTFPIVMGVIWIILMVYLSVVTVQNRKALRDNGMDMLWNWEYYVDDLPDRWLDDTEVREPLDMERYREYLDDDDDTTTVRIEETAAGVMITKIKINPDNPRDTISREMIIIKE